MKVPMKSIAAKSIAPRFCAVTTELVRTALSLACSRRIASVGLLAGLLALLTATVATFAGPTERVSVDSAGNEADRYSASPAISADGRFVAFYSAATNLVPGDTNGAKDVFVRDRLTGITERVGVGGSGYAVGADGRFAAFQAGG